MMCFYSVILYSYREIPEKQRKSRPRQKGFKKIDISRIVSINDKLVYRMFANTFCSRLQLSYFSYREIPEKTRPAHRKGFKKIDYDVTVGCHGDGFVGLLCTSCWH